MHRRIPHMVLVLCLAVGVVFTIGSPASASSGCVGDCNDDRMVSVDELVKGVNIALANAALKECQAFDCNGDGVVTVNCLVKAVDISLNGCNLAPTTTPATPPAETFTPTPTPTNTLGPLGVRHFALDPDASTFSVKIYTGLEIPLGGFQGQSNGQTEQGYLDFQAGQPDAKGFVKVDIIGGSEYLFVDAKDLAGFVICLKPRLPQPSAGVLACNGGIDTSIALDANHNIGTVGVKGFTAQQCEAPPLFGHVETPYATCSAGTVGLACKTNPQCDTAAEAGDGVCTYVPAECTSGDVGAVCEKNADCATDTTAGSCGMPHGGVCNGPLVPSQDKGDAGPGALFIVPLPDPDPNLRLSGMFIELTFESALPCGDEGPGFKTQFALTTGVSHSKVLNANNKTGRTLSFQTQGENFSCENWQDNSQGILVLSAPALDQPTVGDVATLFTFSSHPYQ